MIYSFKPISEDTIFPRWMGTTSVGICPLKPNGKPMKAVKRLKANISNVATLNAAARNYCERLNAMKEEEQREFLQGETYLETIESRE